MRQFHGAKQNVMSAVANLPPGATPVTIKNAPAPKGPKEVAAKAPSTPLAGDKFKNLQSLSRDPVPGSSPATIAKAPATQGIQEKLYGPGFDKLSPETAAATMHNNLAENAREIANGADNVPIHPAQVATEGSDKQGYGGDASRRDPTGIGRGT